MCLVCFYHDPLLYQHKESFINTAYLINFIVPYWVFLSMELCCVETGQCVHSSVRHCSTSYGWVVEKSVFIGRNFGKA